jgi:hypothetical protein
MKKALIIATAAAALGGSVLVYSAFAQQGPGPMMGWRPNTADIGAFQDARIAALKAGLQLNAEQEKLWPPVEAALKDISKNRLARIEKSRAEREKLSTERETQTQITPPDPTQRLRRASEFLGERSTELKRLADAVQPLYEKLDDAQKRRFAVLGRLAMRPGMGPRMMRWRDRADDGWQHRGPMGPRFGWQNDDGPRGPMGPRFNQRDDQSPRGPMGPRFNQRDDQSPRGPMGPGMQRDHHDGRLGLRFQDQDEEQL